MGWSTLAVVVMGVLTSTAQGAGVGAVMVSKSLPPATVAVIDPESGSSSGSSTGTDVRVAAGDVILFRLNYFPVPDLALHGLQGYLTELIPPNTEVVGVRILDAQGNTVRPAHPGISTDGCARPCNRFDSVPCNPSLGVCGASGTRNLDDGSISQLHADTGVFYATDARLERTPGTTFLTLNNGIVMNPAPTSIGTMAPLFGASSPYFAHVAWDYLQVRAFGISNSSGNASGNNGTGNTPFGYGSPVAGPQTFYRYEATERSGRIEFNDVIGPWQRVRYPGSLTGTGAPVTGMGPLRRMVADASALGFDVRPANPIPSSARALRVALGEIRVGEPRTVEVALRVLDTPIDPVQMADVNCGEIFGGDLSAVSASVRARDNMWGVYLPSPACVYLNLLFDLTVDRPLAVTGDTLRYTLRGRNLSTLTQANVVVRQKFDSTRVSLVSVTGSPAMVSNCDGDGLDCLVWTLGTLHPSDEYSFDSTFTVGGGGHITNVMLANYRSDALPAPGFRTQAVNMVQPAPVPGATLAPTSASTPPGGTASLSGTLSNSGTGPFSLDTLTVVMPAGWRAAGAPAITVGGTSHGCSAGCATNTPTFNVGRTLSPGTSLPWSMGAIVASGTPTGLYPIHVQLWGSTTAFGGAFETYFAELATVPVGAVRSDPPVLDCPVLSSWTAIPGSTTEADGTTIRVYFNLIERGAAPSSGGRFAVPFPGFGALYGGLEIRATAQAPGELESELSESCPAAQVAQCQDGIDNDGDGLVDFPADPGCSSPTDGSEDDPECSDGIDNDGDGDIDWPADPECYGPDDDTEFGPPACGDGIDNDGDGLIDYPADPGCTSSTDRSEIQRRRCMNGLDDDGDGLVDFPDDPGCHSPNDDDEGDFAYLPSDVRARLLLVFDTSGSMNWNTCADDYTGGDGSVSCPGNDVSCAACGATGCGNSVADDSRLFQARAGVRDAVAGYGEVEYGLMRFHQRPRTFACPTSNASAGSGGWQGAGAAPCGGGFAGGDLLVGFSPENEYDLLEWMDGSTNYPGGSPPPSLDLELRGTGTTPIAGSLGDARAFLTDVRSGDVAASCRPYRVILITDGQETCGGDPVAAANALRTAGFPTYVIGFATDDPAVRANLDAIALAGGTTSAIFADDATTLSTAISGIVNDSILVETCNGLDDDCDGLVDEGFTLYCDLPGGVTSRTLCADPGERVCDGADDNCDGVIDEGLRNACGTCGAPPAELCNGIDDDCDGPIDEGGVCDICVVEPETCDGLDNDCDGRIDEDLARACGTDVGACTAGTETCVAGTWSACTGTGPTAEVCDGIDNDCDGVIDGITRPCGSSVGACRPGTQLCTGGTWSTTCLGAIGPTAEICDAADNDCDGSVDEGDPGGGGACGSAIGACTPGTLACDGGALVCAGAVGPAAEACNAIDDDCDGLVDEGLPTRGACGACNDGVLTCVGGSYECEGDRAPRAEICNGADDDCDGLIDEGDPDAGAPCGDDTGECRSGVTACVDGMLECVGAVGPTPEVCNALDDDCDGVIDDGFGVGAPCGTDRGECVPGLQVCSAGSIACSCPAGYVLVTRVESGVTVEYCVPDTGGTPLLEICNALDDDCDGAVDEELPLGGACGADEGLCTSGALQCIDGREVCVGEMPGTPEVCDCEDNDCDGSVDEPPDTGALCPPGSQCVDCSCALPCADSEFARCPEGRTPVERDGACWCVAPRCNPGSCAEETIEREGVKRCAPDDPDLPTCVCRSNECTFACAGVVCAEPTVCNPRDGRCVEDNCRGLGCPSGQLCDVLALECVDDPCETASCAADEVCRRGECEASCATMTCAAGDRCHHGECEEDRCAGTACGAGRVCDPDTGGCVDNRCEGVSCPAGAVCEPVDGGCEADPCTFVRCPAGQFCFRGECLLEDDPATDGGSGWLDGGARADASRIDSGLAEDPEERVWAAGGCTCRAHETRSDPPGLALLGLLAAVLVLRRRAR